MNFSDTWENYLENDRMYLKRDFHKFYMNHPGINTKTTFVLKLIYSKSLGWLYFTLKKYIQSLHKK